MNAEEIRKEIIRNYEASLRESLLPLMAENLKRITLISIPRAAAILDVDQNTVRRLITEYVDLGERNTRLTQAQLEDIIKKRTVKK